MVGGDAGWATRASGQGCLCLWMAATGRRHSPSGWFERQRQDAKVRARARRRKTVRTPGTLAAGQIVVPPGALHVPMAPRYLKVIRAQPYTPNATPNCQLLPHHVLPYY